MDKVTLANSISVSHRTADTRMSQKASYAGWQNSGKAFLLIVLFVLVYAACFSQQSFHLS